MNKDHGTILGGHGGHTINQAGHHQPHPPNPQPKQQINNIHQILQQSNPLNSQPTVIQCDLCLKSFKIADTRTHLVDQHDRKTPVECEYCGQIIQLKHYKTHTLFHELETRQSRVILQTSAVFNLPMNAIDQSSFSQQCLNSAWHPIPP
ncbi:MAG: hypothetical protein EZS28_021303, partial [Streblomastix strix]